MTQREYHKLIAEIHEHDRNYYVLAEPVISDWEYDALYKHLQEIESKHPEWVTPNSPTQRIAQSAAEGFTQATHRFPMLSLANTYSKKELEEFVARVHKLLGHSSVSFCCELKMDGIAISAFYSKGKFVQGLTRGDGKTGEEITQNMRTIRSLPLELKVEELDIRGEVFMDHATFEKLNREKEIAGDDTWANPRNAAAGSLKLLDPKEVAKRRLKVVFYGVADEDNPPIGTQFACHQFLADLGLPVFTVQHRRHCQTIEEILEFADFIEKQRKKLPFDIDGIVVKVDELKYHDLLGKTARSPRWAVAYKFAPEQAVTRIREITVQVGRTGVLTPVAELEPVLLAGSTISRATLHNQEEIERKGIREDDWVIIEKGGDVIPKVVAVDLKKRPSHSRVWKMPAKCPSCHSPVIHSEEEVAVRCTDPDCPEQKMRQIIYFASKDAMDIDHFGEKVIEQLFKKGLIDTPAGIYRLTAKDLEQLSGFKEKSIQNLLNSIEKSKHVNLARFLLALGIKYIGEGSADILAREAGSIDALAKMSVEQLQEIEGIGEKMAQAVFDYFHESSHLQEIKKMIQSGILIASPKKIRSTNHHFFGKTFVLTGGLERHTRSEAINLIKERGGKISSSVSKKTDFLLVGEDPGSKLDKAHELHVRLLGEEEFESLL